MSEITTLNTTESMVHTPLPVNGTIRRERDGKPLGVAGKHDYPILADCLPCKKTIRKEKLVKSEWKHLEVADNQHPANGRDAQTERSFKPKLIHGSQEPNLILSEAQALLPNWDLWRIPPSVGQVTYSAKPKGAQTALPGCNGFYDLRALVRQCKRVEMQIGLHIEAAQRQKDLIANDCGIVPEALETRISALLALRGKLRNGTINEGEE